MYVVVTPASPYIWQRNTYSDKVQCNAATMARINNAVEQNKQIFIFQGPVQSGLWQPQTDAGPAWYWRPLGLF